MSQITWAQVVEIAPELSDVALAIQTVILTISDRQINDDVWGDINTEGRRYLSAHIGSIYESSGAVGGVVQSETLGPMSRTYATADTSGGSLATTKYGLFYLYLLNLLPQTIGLVP